MQPATKVDVSIDPVHREVVVVGEVDFATRSAIPDAVTELNAAADGDIDLDLDDVTFIDASGVGGVVSANNQQTSRHTALNVRSSNRLVRRVFAMCGLSWMLTSWTRRPDALASGRQADPSAS